MRHLSGFQVQSPLVAAFLLLTLALVSVAQTGAGNTILGKVLTASGKPLASVIVEIQTGTGALITQTVSTNEGDYAFSGLEGASFTLVVQDPNHEPFAERVELRRTAATRPGEIVRIDIQLRPKVSAQASPVSTTVFQQNVPSEALKTYRSGVRLLAERKSAEGIAALREAIKLFPSYFDAHFALSLEMVRLRSYDEAIRELEAARSSNPRDGRLYYTFGLVLIEQKKYALAVSVLDAAVRLGAANAEAYLLRGTALIELGRLDEAEVDVKRALQQRRLSAAHLHLARIYEKRGDRKRASDELESYLRENPNASNAAEIRSAIKSLRTN